MSGLELILPALGSILGIGGEAAGTGAAVAGGLTGGAMASGAGAAAAAAGAGAAAAGGGLSLGTATTLLGTGLGAAGAIGSGIAAKNQADAEAANAQEQANESAAAGERNAAQQRLRTTLLMSRQRALAAASGGGATDPGVLNLLAQTGAQGDYEADLAKYEGDARANGLSYQAALDRSAGANALTAGFINAGSTMLSGFNEWEKYRRGFYGSGAAGYGGGSYRAFG